MEAQVFDSDRYILFEGEAFYKPDEKIIYVRAQDGVDIPDSHLYIRYFDSIVGVSDFLCFYDGFRLEDSQFVYSFRVEQTINTVQRRNDVKMKTNIPIRISLLDTQERVVIDPETMKAMQLRAVMLDISAGGILIETTYPLNETQKIMFPFDKGSSPIMISAEIIRVIPQEDDVFQYGCKYLNNTTNKESIIREYVFRLDAARRFSITTQRDL